MANLLRMKCQPLVAFSNPHLDQSPARKSQYQVHNINLARPTREEYALHSLFQAFLCAAPTISTKPRITVTFDEFRHPKLRKFQLSTSSNSAFDPSQENGVAKKQTLRGTPAPHLGAISTTYATFDRILCLSS